MSHLILTLIAAFKEATPLGKDVVFILPDEIIAFPPGYMQTE